MEKKSWTYMDKASWPDGEWKSEPDKMQWPDPETGLPCLIVRNRGGALCGYVGVAEGHPLFGVEYSAGNPSPESFLDVHGGITFSDFCQPVTEDGRGICHVPDEGGPDRVYWFGFDCAHYMDLSPAYELLRGSSGPSSLGESYKHVAYVRSECAALAKQLAAMQ